MEILPIKSVLPYHCRATGGRTNTQAALQLVQNELYTSSRGDRNGVDNIAIVVTDGGSTIQSDKVQSSADSLSRNTGKFYSISHIKLR